MLHPEASVLSLSGESSCALRMTCHFLNTAGLVPAHPQPLLLPSHSLAVHAWDPVQPLLHPSRILAMPTPCLASSQASFRSLGDDSCHLV